jgi:hypothetical protein
VWRVVCCGVVCVFVFFVFLGLSGFGDSVAHVGDASRSLALEVLTITVRFRSRCGCSRVCCLVSTGLSGLVPLVLANRKTQSCNSISYDYPAKEVLH